MLLLRQLTPLLRTPTRFYAKKFIKTKLRNRMTNLAGGKQVHKELMRHVDPYARINIRSDIYVRVQSADVHEYPDADVFIAELHGGTVKNCTASMKVQVSEDEKQVDVVLEKLADSSDFHCELAVPVRSELHIETNDSVAVKSMYCAAVEVIAKKNINTKDIRAEIVKLQSDFGNIKCTGMLLGQCTEVETKHTGSITLDKLQGDKLTCKTDEGNISTNSCYVERSKFETNTGCLQLKNVHKTVEVDVRKEGELNMSGVHGNISVRASGGKVNLQLSEIAGDSVIITEKVEQAIINISDAIEEKSNVEITSRGIILDSSLSHLSDCISNNSKQFRISQEPAGLSKLVICSEGNVKLGKLSWMENLRASLDPPSE